MDDRGQVEFDFAVGVSVLVVTILVAFTFVPGLFGGATEGRIHADQVAADRVANWLASDELGDATGTGSVDADCAVAFFDGTAACGFNAGSVTDRVPVEDRHVHVALRRDSHQLCWEETDDRLINETADPVTDCAGTAGYTELAGGATPDGGTVSAVARRPVSVDGYRASVVVRVW